MQKAEILKLRNRGLSVFPVDNSTKVPLIKWARLQEELPSYAEVEEWFSTNNRSVGVAMGRISGLFLLDFDFTKHPESRVWFDNHVGMLPRTWRETTKSGGEHLYFKWVDTLDEKQTNTTSVIAKGVDTKGKGGYSKMTPSDGYKWVNPPHTTTLAVPPQWLLDLLPAKGTFNRGIAPSKDTQGSWLSQALDGLKEGNRNETFTRIAGSLRSRGYGSEDIFGILVSKATEISFPEQELRTICDSVGRYSTGNLGNESAASVEEFLAKTETVAWLVPSIIARKSLGFVVGLPETGKTWSLIDLAIEIAKENGQWLGKFPCQSGRVLFIDQERFKGETQRRFRAVLSAKNIDLKELKGRLFIQCGSTTRINLENSFQAFKKQLDVIRPDLILIDSFATFHTVEENNRGEIQEVLERLKQLRNEFGCTILFVDHENKGAYNAESLKEEPNAFRMAGSIAKPAAAEFVLTVRRNKTGASMVYHTKSTLASTVAPFPIRVRDVEAGKIVVEAY